MMKLVLMTQTEYEPFMDMSVKDQKEGQVLAGEWTAQEADEEMNKLMAQFLPQGLQTPNQFFWTLRNNRHTGKGWGLMVHHH